MSTSTALEFGVISTLRTGHAVYDLMICMIVPAVIQRITLSGKDSLQLLREVIDFIRNLLFPRKYVSHIVETKEMYSRRGKLWDGGESSKDNQLLQKAILLYLAEHLNLDNNAARYELLVRPHAKRKLLLEIESSDMNWEKKKRLAALLKQESSPDVADLQVGPLPPLNEWVKVEEGIEFKNENKKDEAERNSGFQEAKTTFYFRSTLKDGPERIDAFVEKAFEYYRAIESKKFNDDSDRYMYVRSNDRPPAADDDDSSKLSAPYHKRYALGNDKTFTNVFFEEKDQLLQLLTNFEEKTGKFAIEGFPYKLGLLLYGPPGTGKTSLIKAVANHTKRHIINISLGKIKTNQELMDAMFDLRYAVDGLDLPVKMGFKDVVFVMEDIDCASSVVAARGNSTSGATEPDSGGENLERKKEEGDENKEKTSQPDEDVVDVEFDDYDDGEDDGFIGSQLFRRRRRGNHAGFFDMDMDGDDDLLAALLQTQGGEVEFGPKMKGGFVSSSNSSDKLNLAGLLNVLDGVIDCPGRIVIMTTNHPEVLDPALVRPGRISKKIHLGYMNDPQIEQMVAYYFSTEITSEQRSRLTARNHDVLWTPADVEELCAEYDSVDAVLDRITQQEP